MPTSPLGLPADRVTLVTYKISTPLDTLLGDIGFVLVYGGSDEETMRDKGLC